MASGSRAKVAGFRWSPDHRSKIATYRVELLGIELAERGAAETRLPFAVSHGLTGRGANDCNADEAAIRSYRKHVSFRGSVISPTQVVVCERGQDITVFCHAATIASLSNTLQFVLKRFEAFDLGSHFGQLTLGDLGSGFA